jgi:hypothetical protein
MSLHEAARHVLSPLCDERFDGFGVVFTDSPGSGRIPKRRRHAREREQHRLSEVAREVVNHLRQDGDTASVAEFIATAHMKDSIRVTRGYAELIEAVVERFRSGDNVWTDVPGSEPLIVLRFWHDPTHRPILEPYPFSRRS